MNTINCEDVLLAMMALIDGEESKFSSKQIEAHSANCPNCRQEIEQMQNLDKFFRLQKRRESDIDLWAVIRSKIMIQPKVAKESTWYLFLPLVAFLIAFKLLEIIPEHDFGLAIKVIPLALVITLFAFLKENPFKINTKLILEK